MQKIRVLQEIRIMRFEDLYGQWTKGKLTQEEAAMMLGVSDRTFRRYCRDYVEEGASGLYDARLDKPAANAAPIDAVMDLLRLFETHYSNFSVASP